MASKGQGKIAVDGEKAASVLRKLGAARDSPGLPSGFSAQNPPSAAAVSHFNQQMDQYAFGLQRAVTILRQTLLELHDDINKTVTDFASRDESISDEAASMLSSIAPVASTTPSTPATNSNSTLG